MELPFLFSAPGKELDSKGVDMLNISITFPAFSIVLQAGKISLYFVFIN